MTNPLKSREPVTVGRFFATHAAVLFSVLVVGVAGVTAWAQTQTELNHVMERQTKVEHTLENIRETQSQHGAALRGLAEQNSALTMAQQRIYDSLVRLHHRLDDMGDE